MACPRLERRAGEAVDLELDIGIGEDRRVKGERVGRACACAERAMCIERLCAAKQVAEFGVDIGVCFRGAGLGARLDGVGSALNGRDVDVDVGGRRGGNGLAGAVEVDGDGRLEDAYGGSDMRRRLAGRGKRTEAIELVRGLAHLLERVCQRVGLVAVCAQQRLDDPLEETSASAGGMEHADRRDGHGQRRVVVDLAQHQQWPRPPSPVVDAYQFAQALACPLLLGLHPRTELVLLAPLLARIRPVLEPFEDLDCQLAWGCPPEAPPMLTSSSCGEAIGLVVFGCVMLGGVQKACRGQPCPCSARPPGTCC